MKYSDDEILSALHTPLELPAYPNHTQSVEHIIPLVTEACNHKVGYTDRHRLELSFKEYFLIICLYQVNSHNPGVKETVP